MNYPITILLMIINTVLIHISLSSMELVVVNSSMTQIFEIITNIDQHYTQVQDSLKNLHKFYEYQWNDTQHKTLSDHVSTHIDIFHADVQKGNKFLDIKGTFTHELLAAIKKNIMSLHNDQQYLSIIDESITTLTNIRDMTLLKIIGFAQKQQCGTKKEMSELILKSKNLITTYNTMHYLVLYTYYLNKYLPCIKKETTKNDALSILTISKNHIDSLIHKKIKDICADYDETNNHLFFTKKLSNINLEQALLRTYLVHISQDNTELFQLVKKHITAIDNIKEKLQENISILTHSQNVLQQTSLNFKDLLTNLIIIQQYLPSQPMNNQKTELYLILINVLSDYTKKLEIITIEKNFFDITIFTQLVTSYNHIKTVFPFDNNNQQIMDMMQIYENKINQMLDVCIITYKNIINDYDLEILINIIKALFDSCDEHTNEILQPYQIEVINAITNYKNRALEEEKVIQASPQIIIPQINIPIITCDQEPVVQSDQAIIEPDQKIIENQQPTTSIIEEQTNNDQPPTTDVNTSKIIESPILSREQTHETSLFQSIINLCMKPFQLIYALFAWLFS